MNDARTYLFEKIHWDDETVTMRTRWHKPFKGVLHDLDGTLTAHPTNSDRRSLAAYGPNSYVTTYWKHNDQPECTVEGDLYDEAIVCPHPTAVKRVTLYGANGIVGLSGIRIW